MNKNRILDTDSYKTSHYAQYPKGTEKVFSYLESRGSEREWGSTLFFGLQYILKEYFANPITYEEFYEAAALVPKHMVPFNEAGWRRLIEKHHGRLPLRIRAVPEGSIVPTLNALMTVENTDPEFFWLTSYFETQLMRLWYPITVATQSYYLKKLIHSYLEKTADEPDNEVLFKLHDFGARGVSSAESAAIGGAAHLVNFRGTDTIVAMRMLRNYYNHEVSAYSIPAAEHSTITSWGREHEADAYRNMLVQYAKPGGMLAVVSDSWDIYNAVEKIWGETLRQEVIDSGATVVIRPDSGDPQEVVSKVTNLLAEKFGTSVNSKGYKVLNNVRVIQGDGVNPQSIAAILESLVSQGFSATNIAFGMGGALLQKVDRDTLKFAFKCSAIQIGGEWQDVYKDPVTDHGKRSKRGRLDLIKIDDGAGNRTFETIRLDEVGRDDTPVRTAMHTVFQDGEIYYTGDESLERIRERASREFVSAAPANVNSA
jgi:nicotinamide phosphoribosyltransferase